MLPVFNMRLLYRGTSRFLERKLRKELYTTHSLTECLAKASIGTLSVVGARLAPAPSPALSFPTTEKGIVSLPILMLFIKKATLCNNF